MSLIDDLTTKPRFLIFDIETAPSLAWMWQQWKGDIVATEQDWHMLCFAYKWFGEDEVHFKSLPDRKSWRPDSPDDKYLARELWKLFDEADVVLAHNGDKFDIPKVQARFLYHRLGPTSTFQSIDTVKLYRKHFSLYSNSLNEIARYLGLEQKVAHVGFKLWRACMAGDPEAWEQMRVYNTRDVEVLEAAYLEVQPWVNRTKPNPNFNFAHFAEEGANVCPACGARDTLRLAGWKRTGVSEFPELWCYPKKGGCGARPRKRYRRPQHGGGVKSQ